MRVTMPDDSGEAIVDRLHFDVSLCHDANGHPAFQRVSPGASWHTELPAPTTQAISAPDLPSA